MTTTYKWTITMLECVPSANGLENIVQTIRWKLSGDDEVNYAEISGITTIMPPDPTDFVQYTNLTEEQVVTWLIATIGEDGVASATSTVDSILESLSNPPVITPTLPWETPPAE